MLIAIRYIYRLSSRFIYSCYFFCYGVAKTKRAYCLFYREHLKYKYQYQQYTYDFFRFQTVANIKGYPSKGLAN